MNAPRRNDTQERAVKAYLPPLYARYTLGYKLYTGMSTSECVATAIKKFFDEMAPTEKDKILRESKNTY